MLDLDGLFRAHATSLLRLAVVLTGDRALSEELVQESFVRLHRAATPPAAGAELAYLRRTVMNLSHSYHRHLRVVRRTLTPAAVDVGIRVGSVKTHLHRARAALADRLEALG